MLIVLSFANPRRRRVRAAWMAAFVCGVCLERLAVLHVPVGTEARAASWVLQGVPSPVTPGLAPNHARFQSQRDAADASLGDQSSLRLPGDLLAAELPAGFLDAGR